MKSRAQIHILISDAQTTAALACLRSLTKAGYRVHVMQEAQAAFPICWHSTCPHHRTESPAYSSPEFIPYLKAYVEQHKIALILPTERFLTAIATDLNYFSPLLAQPSTAEELSRALSKHDLFASFAQAPGGELRQNLPPYLLIDIQKSLPTAGDLAPLPLPLFLKVDRAHRSDGGPAAVFRVASVPAALEKIAELKPTVQKILVQGFVPGVGVGAFFIVWNGQIRAEYMHKRNHEVPHTGGYSSLRSIYRDERVLADAHKRAQFLKWQGPAMFEYRQDPQSGDFWLMELNPRFWGSLHLALLAGLELPALLADLKFQLPLSPMPSPQHVSARLLVPGEIQWLFSRLRDDNLSFAARLKSLGEFLTLFFKPGVHDDLFYPGDRRVFFAASWAYAGEIFKSLKRRLKF